MFDFTSIHQAEYAARAIRRGGKDLYLCLIGDALLEVSTYTHQERRACGSLEKNLQHFDEYYFLSIPTYTYSLFGQQVLVVPVDFSEPWTLPG